MRLWGINGPGQPLPVWVRLCWFVEKNPSARIANSSQSGFSPTVPGDSLSEQGIV